MWLNECDDWACVAIGKIEQTHIPSTHTCFEFSVRSFFFEYILERPSWWALEAYCHFTFKLHILQNKQQIDIKIKKQQ